MSLRSIHVGANGAISFFLMAEWYSIVYICMCIYVYIHIYFLVAHIVNNLPAMQETQVQSLGWEDPLEDGTTTHSRILVWRIPWTEECSGLQSIGLQRVGHDWSNLAQMHAWQPYSSHHTQWWRAESILPKIWNKTRMSTLTNFVKHSFGLLQQSENIKREK